VEWLSNQPFMHKRMKALSDIAPTLLAESA